MKNVYKSLAISGANLLALTLNTGDATTLKPQFTGSAAANPVQRMTESQLRAIEASHLEIYAACKWGHAAFDPVIVEHELLPPEIQYLYEKMALI